MPVVDDTAANGTVTGVLLIAHGSRQQAANDDLLALAEMVRQQREYDVVEVAYLELAQPDILQGARICIENGATHVRMLPFFLSAGRHVVSDLTRHLRELATEFPQLSFELCPPLGLHPLVVQVVLDRLKERLPEAGGG